MFCWACAGSWVALFVTYIHVKRLLISVSELTWWRRAETQAFPQRAYSSVSWPWLRLKLRLKRFFTRINFCILEDWWSRWKLALFCRIASPFRNYLSYVVGLNSSSRLRLRRDSWLLKAWTGVVHLTFIFVKVWHGHLSRVDVLLRSGEIMIRVLFCFERVIANIRHIFALVLLRDVSFVVERSN